MRAHKGNEKAEYTKTSNGQQHSQNNFPSEAKQDSVKLNDIKAKDIQWLWPGKIPRGKLTILAGEPDSGKSFLTLDFAARVSAGHSWPDGQPCEQGQVLLLTAEDDLKDTVKPRLDGLQADSTRVQALEKLTVYDPQHGPVKETPSIENLDALKEELTRVKPSLVVIDPVNAYLANLDTHKDAELRAKVFGPLKEMAEEHNVALICVMHLNKSTSQTAKNRVSGSVAYVAASRATWLVSNDQDDHERKKFLPVKFNVGPKPDGSAFRINHSMDKLGLEWESDPVTENPDEELQPETDSTSVLEAAKEFLQDILQDGPVPGKEILQKSDEVNLSNRSIYRAKKSLDIKSEKQGKGEWRWKLPD
jgi:archaellum biogenesis ATPase FlaH